MKQRAFNKSKLAALAASLMPKRFGASRVMERKSDYSTPHTSFLDDVIAAPFFELDIEGRILKASSNCLEYWGVDSPRLLGTAFLDRVHTEDRLEFLRLFADLREVCVKPNTGTSVSPVVIRIRLRSVRMSEGMPEFLYRNYKISAVPIIDPAKLQGRKPYIGLITMIDEEIIALLQKNEQLEDYLQQAKTSATHAIDMVGHELRTPLNAMIGYADLLMHPMSENLADKEKQRYIEVIQKSGSYLLSIVNSILENAKINNGMHNINLNICEVNKVLNSCLELITPLALEKKLHLECIITENMTPSVFDERAMQQIMLNILSNAIKFTPEGGSVTIQADANLLKGELIISVSDTGIGIAAEDVGRLKLAYQQGHYVAGNDFHGIGLGLSLVEGLVKLHHGKLEIISGAGEGTTVTVTLPLNSQQNDIPEIADKATKHSVTMLTQLREVMERQYDSKQTKIGEQSDAQTRKIA